MTDFFFECYKIVKRIQYSEFSIQNSVGVGVGVGVWVCGCVWVWVWVWLLAADCFWQY
jgi:hypothetical protein